MTRVLIFGDSNTHGTEAMGAVGERRRFGAETRWPDRAAARLGADWWLLAEGQPGRTTVHPDPVEGGHKAGLAVLPALLESHAPLDAVVVMLGTNDLKHRFAATAGDVALGLERCLDAILASRVGPAGGAPQVLLVAPPPIAETGVLADVFTGGAATSRRMGAAIGAMAARRGVSFLDAGEVVSVDPRDGIHLDSAAHAALAEHVATALRDLVATGAARA